jgi:hypothetical protein
VNCPELIYNCRRYNPVTDLPGVLMRRLTLIAIISFAPVHMALADWSAYVGAGGVYSNLESNSFTQDTGPTSTTTVGSFKDSATGWQLFGGFMFTENFGLAAKYYDSGKAKDQWSGVETTVTTIPNPIPPPATIPSSTDTPISFTGDMQITGYTLYVVQTVPVTKRTEFTLELGYADQDIDFNVVSMPFTGPIKRDDTGFAIGGIFRYKFLKFMAISGEVEYLTVNFGGLIERPLRFAVNLEAHF